MSDETTEKRLLRLELWRNGNGARGAEERLQTLEANARSEKQAAELVKRVCAEGNYVTMDQIEAIIKNASSASATEIVSSAKRRDKTVTARIKAFAPYFASFIALLVALLEVAKK